MSAHTATNLRVQEPIIATIAEICPRILRQRLLAPRNCVHNRGRTGQRYNYHRGLITSTAPFLWTQPGKNVSIYRGLTTTTAPYPLSKSAIAFCGNGCWPHTTASTIVAKLANAARITGACSSTQFHTHCRNRPSAASGNIYHTSATDHSPLLSASITSSASACSGSVCRARRAASSASCFLCHSRYSFAILPKVEACPPKVRSTAL